MKIKVKLVLKLMLAALGLLFWIGIPAYAANTITSKGFPPTTVITLDGVASEPAWAATGPPTNLGNAPAGSLIVLHTADSIYFLASVTDNGFDPSDAVTLRFAVGANCNADFGLVVPRSGTATWGANACSGAESGWATMPASNFFVKDNGNTWVVELKVPLALPTGQTIPLNKNLGFAFAFCDGAAFCVYNPWPPAADFNTPASWGKIIFDPQTTFPDVAAINSKTTNTNPNQVLYAPNANTFIATVKNNGGAAIADANNVRINLYLAARGIGEPWHRFDSTSILTNDCSSGISEAVIPKSQVCSGSTPLPDVGSAAISINDIVNNSASYTIQAGVTRSGGDNLTIANGAQSDYTVMNWTLTSDQDPRFRTITVGANTYNRAHLCMLTEVVSPNDPNSANNLKQINLDFPAMTSGHKKALPFVLAPGGFKKYDPNVGKSMLLQVVRTNMDERFQLQLNGVKRLENGLYEAPLKGTASIPVSADMTAPSGDIFGKTLKSNLIVPPRAGANLRGPDPKYPSRSSPDQPVRVRVTPGTTVWISNFGLNDKDTQFVDVDGPGRLPHSGPDGLPATLVKNTHGALLVPAANVGELVLSFDNFKHGVGIGEGVQVNIPAGMNELFLAINDSQLGYKRHTGTGFRLLITERPAHAMSKVEERRDVAAAGATTEAADAVIVRGGKLTPIGDVLPQACVNGYEDLNEKIVISGKPLEMYRLVGNVCWRINAILKGEVPPVEKGDPPPTRTNNQ